MKICEAKICLWSKENMGLPQSARSAAAHGGPPPPRLTVAMDVRSGTMLLPQNSLHPLNFFSCAQRYAHMHSPQSATHTVYAVPPQFLHANNSTNGTNAQRAVSHTTSAHGSFVRLFKVVLTSQRSIHCWQAWEQVEASRD